jgi:hypothetical protein
MDGGDRSRTCASDVHGNHTRNETGPLPDIGDGSSVEPPARRVTRGARFAPSDEELLSP